MWRIDWAKITGRGKRSHIPIRVYLAFPACCFRLCVLRLHVQRQQNRGGHKKRSLWLRLFYVLLMMTYLAPLPDTCCHIFGKRAHRYLPDSQQSQLNQVPPAPRDKSPKAWMTSWALWDRTCKHALKLHLFNIFIFYDSLLAKCGHFCWNTDVIVSHAAFFPYLYLTAAVCVFVCAFRSSRKKWIMWMLIGASAAHWGFKRLIEKVKRKEAVLGAEKTHSW